jgi:hypothetical protein
MGDEKFGKQKALFTPEPGSFDVSSNRLYSIYVIVIEWFK